MKPPSPEHAPIHRKWAILLILLAALVPAPGQQTPDQAGTGARMYRDGILPSGQPMRAQGPGGDLLKGTTFPCASCHLPAGLGTADERQVIPPVNGPRLFSPSYQYFPFLTGAERAKLPAVARDPLRRPAYSEATLVTAIREGVDSAGRALSQAMPRYPLDAPEMESLVRYLKGLSSELSPGVSQTTLRFATIVTDGVPPQDREAMLATMRHQLAIHNQVYEKRLRKPERITAMQEMTLPLRKWELAVWELNGPSSTWRAQLEAHLRAQPVFALVGGLSDGDWLPVHAFCQDRGIPCILPLTDYPVTSPASRYTLYFTGGLHQEGVTAGDRVADALEGGSDGPVLQVVQDTPAGRALARGFREALARRGVLDVQEVPAPAGDLPGPFLARLLAASHGKAILALWGGREVYTALAQAAAGPEPPALVFMSASLLQEALWDLPQDARPGTLLTYPYRLPRAPSLNQDPSNLAPVRPVATAADRRVRSRTFTLMQVLDEGVRGMARDFYRDNLLDRIGLMDDKTDSDYATLSFTPGQPWLSTGCQLVRLAGGSSHSLAGQDEQT